jgi:hypothetical protein
MTTQLGMLVVGAGLKPPPYRGALTGMFAIYRRIL